MNVSRAQGILGIDSDATPAEIKKAYRQLALQHHPDKGGDKNKFQEISRAYKRVTDPSSAFGDQDSEDEDDDEGGKLCVCMLQRLFFVVVCVAPLCCCECITQTQNPNVLQKCCC